MLESRDIVSELHVYESVMAGESAGSIERLTRCLCRFGLEHPAVEWKHIGNTGNQS